MKIGSITLSFSQNFTINKLKNLARKNPDNANTNSLLLFIKTRMNKKNEKVDF